MCGVLVCITLARVWEFHCFLHALLSRPATSAHARHTCTTRATRPHLSTCFVFTEQRYSQNVVPKHTRSFPRHDFRGSRLRGPRLRSFILLALVAAPAAVVVTDAICHTPGLFVIALSLPPLRPRSPILSRCLLLSCVFCSFPPSCGNCRHVPTHTRLFSMLHIVLAAVPRMGACSAELR